MNGPVAVSFNNDNNETPAEFPPPPPLAVGDELLWSSGYLNTSGMIINLAGDVVIVCVGNRTVVRKTTMAEAIAARRTYLDSRSGVIITPPAPAIVGGT